MQNSLQTIIYASVSVVCLNGVDVYSSSVLSTLVSDDTFGFGQNGSWADLEYNLILMYYSGSADTPSRFRRCLSVKHSTV